MDIEKLFVDRNNFISSASECWGGLFTHSGRVSCSRPFGLWRYRGRELAFLPPSDGEFREIFVSKYGCQSDR